MFGLEGAEAVGRQEDRRIAESFAGPPGYGGIEVPRTSSDGTPLASVARTLSRMAGSAPETRALRAIEDYIVGLEEEVLRLRRIAR